MLQEKLSDLAILAMKQDILDTIDFDNIQEFAAPKSRKNITFLDD